MNLYTQIARSHLGSSLLFGAFFLVPTVVSDGFIEAASVGALAAASWFAAHPLIRRLSGALHGA